VKTLEEKALTILLAMDIASQNMAARDFALSLARRLKAEIIGLIVEDEILLQSTQYPFASEIVSGSAVERKLDYSNMERSLRAWSTQTQNQLSMQAQRANIKCSFRTYRGRTTETLLGQSESASLVIFSGLRISRFQTRPRSHIAYILVDDNTNLENSLKILSQLMNEGMSEIVFIKSGKEQSKAIIEPATQALLNSGIQTHVKTIETNLPQQLAIVLRNQPAAVVIIPATHSVFQETKSFRELQNYLSCPVLVVK